MTVRRSFRRALKAGSGIAKGRQEIFMRFVLAIALFSVLAEPAYAEEPTQPNSGTQLIELCNRDRARCEQIFGIVIKTGVDAGVLPVCTSSVNLPDLTEKILNWWKLYPEQAENPVVRSVAYALRALKPC
jgi:hypothetical protein